MSRRSLHRYNNATFGDPLLAETPMGHTTNIPGRISTPPHSMYVKRPQPQETPIRDPGHISRNPLLLPAFSSPQRLQPPMFDLVSKQNAYLGPAASLDAEPYMNRVTPVLEKKKRLKKPRREIRDTGFSLDSAEKPPYSYATLIGMSILTHPDKQLTLLQIYLWISLTFKYYRREDVGWQNLIRHNLSLNKAFVKGAKLKDGKGHFWCIKEECEELFLKAKNNKKSLYHEVMDQIVLQKRTAAAAAAMLPSSPTTEDDRKRPLENESMVSSKRLRQSVDSDSDTGPDVDLSLLRTPSQIDVVTESPDKPLLAGKHLLFASSFSCLLNFELSPAHVFETGPLLEPLTPLNSATAPGTDITLLQPGLGAVHLPTITVNHVLRHNHLQTLQPPMVELTPRAGTSRTPKSGTKTPLRTLRTPMGSAVVRKLWQSPSYLEEFYYSPFEAGRAVLNSYDDDDMLMRAFDSPAASKGKTSLLHDLRRAGEE